ncbi:MAG: class I SAM-dependent DNA methyltransferase [Phycisphaerales bacterium]
MSIASKPAHPRPASNSGPSPASVAGEPASTRLTPTGAAAEPSSLRQAIQSLEMALPADTMEQDEEWVVVKHKGAWRKIRLHDYDDVFAVPGLYEKWVYEHLKCSSPQKVRDLLARSFVRERVDPATIVALDLGAGNGFVAEELSDMGIKRFIGVDIVPNAAVAAERDRPGLYEDFIIGDMLNLNESSLRRLDTHRYTLMTCVAALGFGDIPTAVFAAAYNRVIEGGWVAFNIKSDFLEEADPSGFSKLIRTMLAENRLDLESRESYVHRLAPDGSELIYDAFVGRKRGEIPQEWIDAAD